MEQSLIIDYNNLAKKIEEFQERLKAHRQERIARGLPPEHSEHFVGRGLSTLLSDKVEHLFKYFKGYSALLTKTKTLQLTQYSEIYKKYGDYILLLSEATNLEHRMTGQYLQRLLKTLHLIEEDMISYEKATREFYYAFKDLEFRDCGFSRFGERPLPAPTKKQ
ncbi:hypothetical protein ABEX39_26495 [Bacillus albus]|uniref:hypothetical protein n=1 Tax=Bacillus albus TaxID=2026189 RepID=UPI003D1C4F98